MTEQAKPEIVEVRLVRVELVAYYEARDADGDPVGPAIVYSDKENKPISVVGKSVAGLHEVLLAQCPQILARLLAAPTARQP